jgi:regulator of replication initiation timing
MKTDKTRVFVIYNGETANPRIVQFNGYPIGYAEQVKVIEYTAVEQLEQNLKNAHELNHEFASKIEQLEQKVKEYEFLATENPILCQRIGTILNEHDKTKEKLTAAEARVAAQERVIEKQAQELDKLYPLITKICTVSNGISFFFRNESERWKLRQHDDLLERIQRLYDVQCDLEQLTKVKE